MTIISGDCTKDDNEREFIVARDFSKHFLCGHGWRVEPRPAPRATGVPWHSRLGADPMALPDLGTGRSQATRDLDLRDSKLAK